jgi:hypothetical protein
MPSRPCVGMNRSGAEVPICFGKDFGSRNLFRCPCHARRGFRNGRGLAGPSAARLQGFTAGGRRPFLDRLVTMTGSIIGPLESARAVPSQSIAGLSRRLS